MTMVRISEVFEVVYGSNLELNALEQSPNGINFVSRTARNNGVSARVCLLPFVQPLPAGILSVAGGGSVLQTFVQPEPFYSGRDLYVLYPREDLTLEQKLYACMCIKANKYRFNYGRQANRTLRDLHIPDPRTLPAWVTPAFAEVVGLWRTVGQSIVQPPAVMPPLA